MEYNLENNAFIAFFNDYGLRKNPKSPTFTGNINVNGKQMRISIWDRTSKSGKRMITGNIQEMPNYSGQHPDDQPNYKGMDSSLNHPIYGEPKQPGKPEDPGTIFTGSDDLPF